MKNCLVGMVSWCDSVRFPERFSVFKKSVNSLERYLEKTNCVTAVVDNDSTEDVKTYISSRAFFDVKVLLPENTQDVGAYAVLAQVAKDKQLDYIWILENDYVMFRKFNPSLAIAFLKKHPECGYIRLQKFEFANLKKYDKSAKLSAKDIENSVWLKNLIDGKELKWSQPFLQNNECFYINNWHFGMHGGLLSINLWNKLFPALSKPVPYYYKLETQLRQKYHRLKFKTAVLDKGVFTMAAPSVYQPKPTLPLADLISQKLYGPQGGFIDGSIIRHYQTHYADFPPLQIQLFSNSLGDEEISLLRGVFTSHWLGYGAKSKEFETKFAELIGVKHALGITSCTSGLFMSMEMLEIGLGDEVIIPSIGFIGCANAVRKAGAKPVFVDVHPRTLNILPEAVAKAITAKTKAVIVLHYGGVPCDMNALKRILAKHKHKIYLIEDSANSIYSTYHGRYCGTLGDIGLFSLDANKVITTGTGGILTTNADDLYHKAKVARFYGLRPTAATGYDAMKSRKERWWEIDLEYHGNRYLINDITSAIALAQLPKLNRLIAKRKKIWHYYNQQLKSIKLITLPPPLPKYSTSSYYFYWIQTRNEADQLSLAHQLVSNGIYTTFRYYPLHLIDYYKSRAKLPNSELIAKTTLNLPFHQNLTNSDLRRIVYTIKNWASNR